MYPELLISAIALMISALSALATLYLAQQLSILRRTYLREAKASQMERTLRAVQLPPEISATIDSFLHRSRRGDEVSFEHLSIDDYETSLEVTNALEFLETLATGILSGVYDESIAYSRLGDRIVYFYEATKLFIYESQSQSLASLYVQLTQLARHWQSRTQRVNYRL